MEKRNFVTSKRSDTGFATIDDMVDMAVSAFSNSNKKLEKYASELTKKASLEDEKTDAVD